MKKSLVVLGIILSFSGIHFVNAQTVNSDPADYAPEQNHHFPYQKYIVGIDFCYGSKTSSSQTGLSPDAQQYNQSLSTGLSYRISLTTLISEKFAIGLRYHSLSSSAATSDFPYLQSNGQTEIIQFSEKINLTDICITGYYRAASANNRHYFLLGGGFGFMQLNDRMNLIYNHHAMGTTACIFTTAEYGIMVSRKISIDASVSYQHAKLRYEHVYLETQSNEVELNPKLDISNFDAGIGIKFHL